MLDLEMPLKHEIAVYVETGAKRVFASAVEWPGWSRGAKDEHAALQALAAYGSRYAGVVGRVFTGAVPADPSAFEVVKRLRGNSGTDFGVPTLGIPADTKPIDDVELDRLEKILRASWGAFDKAARAARGHTLRKGPRGGGRDLEKIAAHVFEAEEAYIVQLGASRPKPTDQPVAPRVARLRTAILDALRARAQGLPIADPSRAKTLWTPRYFVRRAAWHVLDHTWEIEDRVSG
ncbi:MAG: hypothetical protein ACRDG6_04790 [Candidatus Limnocylindria bacterium]